jgi:hypothetical protein
MKKQILRISPHQSSKVMALIYFIFMLLLVPIGVIMLLVGGKDRSIGFIFVFAPLIYGVTAYVMFGLFAWVYNFVAKRLGGIEFTTTETQG